MNKTFCRKGYTRYKIAAIVFIALFLLLSLFGISVYFLENRAVLGFDKSDPEAVAAVRLGLGLLGFFALVGTLAWLELHRDRFTIKGTTLSRQSLYRRHEFELADLNGVESLAWGSRSIVFHARGKTSRLELSLIGDEDLLEFIEILRDRVPASSQKGWPLFCLKVALPLKEERLQLPKSALEDLPPGSFLNTRRRYDRAAAIAIPLSLGLGVIDAVGFQQWQGLLSPIPVVAAWLLLRFHLPPEGKMERGTTPSWILPALGICMAVAMGGMIFMGFLRAYGLTESPWSWIPWCAMTGGCVMTVLLTFVADWKRSATAKQRLAVDELAAIPAQERWLELTPGGNQVEAI